MIKNTIYIAGPLTPRRARQDTDDPVLEYLYNVRDMLNVKRQLIKRGWSPFCPGEDLLTFLAGGDDVIISGEQIKRNSLDHLLRCDAIVLIGNWTSSPGARAEHEAALEHGLDVYYELEAVRDAPKEP